MTPAPLSHAGATEPATLAARAAAVRAQRAKDEAEHRAFVAVLATPCPEHHARPGHACWQVRPGDPNSAVPAVCGPRIQRTVGAATSRRMRRARGAAPTQ